MKKKIKLCSQIRFPGFHGLDGCDGLSVKTLRLSRTSSYKTSRLTILYSGKNPSGDTLHKLSCSVRQSIILVIAVLHRIIMAVADFNSVSPVGFSKFDTHLLYGSGFAFPLKRLSVSSKAFKSMAALTAAPAVGISETFDNLRKRGQVCGFLIFVSFFSVLTFFLGCPFVICLDGRKIGEKNDGF